MNHPRLLLHVIMLSILVCAVLPFQTGIQDLDNLDINSIISMPLIAAQDAQIQTVLKVLHFLLEFGFEMDAQGQPDLERPKNLIFAVAKTDPSNGSLSTINVTVPLLSLINVPFFDIDELSIVLRVNLKTTYVSAIGTSGSELIAGFKGALVSTSRNGRRVVGDTRGRDYSMEVRALVGRAPVPLFSLAGVGLGTREQKYTS